MKTEPYTEHCQLLDLLRSMIIFVFPSVVSFTTGSFKVILQETIRNDFQPLKVMLLGTIRNNHFWHNRALQHCWDIVLNACNIVPTLQRCVALKMVVANRPQ